jgi:hypothetical protein
MSIKFASDHDGCLGLEIHADAEEVVEAGSVSIHVVVEVDEIKGLVPDSEVEDLQVGGGRGVGQVGVDQAFGVVGDASVRHYLRNVV